MKTFVIVSILSFGLFTVSADAAPIAGVTAISSYSTATANRTPASAVNGSGLNSSATPDVPASWTHQGGNGQFGVDLNWLAFARATDPLPGVENHWIGFDLGATVSLESLSLFNLGVSGGGNNDRGVNQGDIYYRSDSFGNNSDNNRVAFDNTDWTLLGTAGAQTFAIGPNDGSFQGATNVPLGGISARYFAIDINSDHGDGGFVGIGEVQFFGTSGPASLTGSNMVDNQGGGPVNFNLPVTYTVAFSKDMDESTVSEADFDNAGTATITIDSVDEVTPGVFAVVVTPTTLGTLQLRVPVSASITDAVGNPFGNDPAIVDDTTIDVITDITAPTLAESDIVDDQGGMPVVVTTRVTYTLTFSEVMNALTVDTDDFENAGSPAATIMSVSETADPAVFEVVVEPGGVGTLQLQIKAGANLEDPAGHALDTSSAITDPTVLAVNPAPPPGALVTDVAVISSFSVATANRTPVSAIDGSGLNVPTTPDEPASWTHQGGSGTFGETLNWLAFARTTDPLPGVENHWIAFDLGETVPLGSMNVFNFGVSTGGNNARGVNQGDIYYRTDSFGNNSDNNDAAFDKTGWKILGTAGDQTFEIGPNDGSFQGATNVRLPISARYIAIDVNSSHGDSNFVGLGEVQFFSGSGGTAFRFEIANNGANLDLEWESQSGMFYVLRSSIDPAADFSTWDSVNVPGSVDNNGVFEIATNPPLNSHSIPRPGDPARFYRVEELLLPPVELFSDDFEGGQGRWTVVDESTGAATTTWELGTPDDTLFGGPPTAPSGVNVFATDIDAPYVEDTLIRLRSSAIDLTTVPAATVNYSQWRDIEVTFDSGQVRLLDAGDLSELAVLQTVDGSSDSWEEVSIDVPPEALGKSVIIEFTLQSDNFGNQAGWHLDDVTVTTPAP